MPISRLAPLNLVIATAYFLLGKVGLALALPPGYVSAVWPAAGLAFASALVWGGRRIWVGIFLGAAIVNASVGPQFQFNFLVVGIAVGSTIQAIVGAAWVHRVIPDLMLDRPDRVLRFSVVGVSSCLIAASIGNACLLLSGVLTSSQIAQSFVTWWLGDAFGVQIFAPIVLLALAHQPVWKHRRLTVGLPLLVAFALFGVIYSLVKEAGEKQLITSMSSVTEPGMQELEELDRVYGNPLRQLALTYQVSGQPPGPEFQEMVAGIRKILPAFRAIAWAPILVSGNQATNEKTNATKADSSSTAHPAQEAAPGSKHLTAPIQLISPLTGNEAVLGLDVLGEPVRARALRQALDSGEMTMTEPVRLAQDPSGPGGTLLMAPVLAAGVRGVISGVIDLRQIDNKFASIPGIVWQLRATFPDGERNLWQNQSLEMPAFSTSSYIDRRGVFTQRAFRVGGRDWRIVLFLPHSALANQVSNAPLLVLFLALFSCGVFANFALIMSSDRERIASEVNSKTKELNAQIEIREQADEALRNSESHLRNVLGEMPIGVSIVGADGNITFRNRRFVEMFGYTQEDTPNLVSWWTLAYPDPEYQQWVRTRWHAVMVAAHDGRSIIRPEIYTIRTKTGEVMRVEISGIATDAGFVATFVDHTQHQLQQQQLRDATAAAEAASESKSVFLANMSHEIRTPMNAILGMLHLLQSTSLDAQQVDYARKTEGAAKSLLGLLNDILDFSKVEAGKMSLESEPFRIDWMLRSLAVVLTANLGTKDIEVLYDVDPSLPEVVRGDTLRLQQVLINLCGNAIKFTSQGHVVLSLTNKGQSERSVFVEFSVQDTGIGIALEQQENVFDSFSQAEASTTRRFGGTGLGLAICKRLVELMGGDIRINSAPGVGSTFSFTVELAIVQKIPDELKSSTRSVSAMHKALVVDDNAFAGELMTKMLRSWGWTTDLATGGDQALSMIRASFDSAPYSVIYVDWQMPVMDGWATVREIRQWEVQTGSKRSTVIMVTAHGRELLVQRSLAEQDLLDGFLVKPTTASMLLDAVIDAQGSSSGLRKVTRGSSSQRRLSGLRILVVEDNLINQQVAEELLTAEGALVSLAANGQQGIEAVSAAAPQFDVVLMDIQMPVVDGYEATRVIREQLGLPDLPIVAMTANAMASDRDACLASGMNEHVGKPFDISKLVSTLIRVTGLVATSTPIGVGVKRIDGSAQNEIPGLDLQTALARMSGLTSLYVRTARNFSEVLATAIPELKALIDTGDIQRAQMLLHTLKGNAGTLGALKLAEEARELEELCRVQMPNQAWAPHLDDLAALVEQGRKDLLHAADLLDTGKVPLRDVASVEFDTELARSALEKLSSLLNASDLTVLKVYADLQPILNGLPSELVNNLAQAVQELNFDDAKKIVAELQTVLSL